MGLITGRCLTSHKEEEKPFREEMPLWVKWRKTQWDYYKPKGFEEKEVLFSGHHL